MTETQNRHSRPADPITLHLLGPMRMQVAGTELELPARKARALVAYLALRSEVAVPRETLAGLLWAERGDDQARASLRQTLAGVRKALGSEAEALVATTEAVTFASDRVWVDVAALEDAAGYESIDELIAAVSLYRGELLEGLSLAEPAFEQWLSGERARVRELLSRLHLRLVDRLERDQRFEEALTYGARLPVLDPLQEQVHRTLMRLAVAHRAGGASVGECCVLAW